MRRGAWISGALHLVLVALAIWGADWFRDREPVPLNVTEIEMVEGSELDARLSTAPVVQSEGPAELAPPSPGESAPTPEAPPEDAADHASAAALAVSAPPEPRPDAPRVTIPPPPTAVPSEAPVPTIAEIPSPDPLKEQSAQPESPPSTEPVQPLASVRPPTPSPRPLPPPEAEPAPEPEQTVAQERAPEPEVAEKPQPEPAPVETPPAPETEIAAAEPEAEQSLAPQEARLPVARPADRARAAPASSEPEPPAERQVASAEPTPEKEPKPQKQAEPTPAKPAGGSSRPTAPLSIGEKNALRLGIKKYYVYNGDRSDRTLQVTIRVRLDQRAKITGKPEMIASQGGTPGSQKALFDAGRRALLRAEASGEFDRLPKDKSAAWSVLNVVFTTDKGVDFSS